VLLGVELGVELTVNEGVLDSVKLGSQLRFLSDLVYLKAKVYSTAYLKP
jgi:hypothetical protein